MTAKEYQYWVNRLAQYDPRDSPPGSPRDKAYSGMIRVGIPLKYRVAISKAACKLFEERKPRPVGPEAWEQEYECSWVDEAAEPVNPYPDSTYYRYEFRPRHYGKSIIEQAMRDLAMCGHAFIKFNTEGEKQMEKIDWHKPLRSLKPGRGENPKVYTYKSGKQRVVWIDDRVYPVDEQGRAVADVNYGVLPGGTGWVGAVKGSKIVENVPEEKFFLGLARDPDGTYWLTDDGMPTTMSVMNGWKRTMTNYQPHWIVDTRKPAEPPKAVVHDPKDWTTITVVGDRTLSNGEKIVRVRTTPPPADTARYVQLWRTREGAPWLINKTGDGRQEFTWAETWRRGVNPTQCAIKVRD